jgi:hypothetical protein
MVAIGGWGGVRILHTKNAIFIIEGMHKDTVPTEKVPTQYINIRTKK